MFSLRNLVKKSYDQVNPFDGGKSFSNQQPQQAPAPPRPASTAAPLRSNPIQVQQVQRPMFNANPLPTPTPKPLTVGVAPQQNLQVGKATIAPVAGTQTGAKPFTPDTRGALAKTPVGRVIGGIGTGAARSAVGTSQAVSGLADLISPGTGTNRFSDLMKATAEGVDAEKKAQGYNTAAYKGAQLAGDLATFAVGGAQAKAANVAATKAIPALGAVSPFIERGAFNATKGLAERGFGGRVAADGLRVLAKPGYQASNAAFGGIQLGKMASQGEDINAGNVAANIAPGLALPFAGAAAKQAALPAVRGAVNAARNANLIAPSRLNPDEVSALSNFAQQARSGAIMDEGTYQNGLAAAQKAGIDYRDPKAVDDLIGAHRNYEQQVANRKEMFTPQPLNAIGAVGKDVRGFQDKFDNFTNETGDPKIDARIKEISQMSPDEYLQQAFNATDGKLGGSYDSWLASNAQDAMVAKQYAEAMQNGDRFPLPYIDNAMGSQDGRNRAIAAKLAGKDTIPVGVIPEMTTAEKIAFTKEQIAKYPEKSYLGNKYRNDLAELNKANPTPAAAPRTKLVPQSADAAPVAKPRTKLVSSEPLHQNTPVVSIPKDAPVSGEATRGFGQTINKDLATGDDVKKAVSELSYGIRNTKDLQTRAANLIKDDPALALRVAQTDNTDIGVMLSNQLVPQLSRNGQPDLAIELAKRTAEVLTKSGQTSQAAAAYGKLAPEGILRFTQNIVKQYNDANNFKAGKELVLSADKAQSIMAKSAKLQDMPEGRAKDSATKQMLKEIKEVVPASWVAKLSTVQTIGQLLNPKTLIRNLAGNGGFGGVLENASQVIAAGVDKGISLGTGKRAVALPDLKTQTKGFVKGGKQQIEELKKGVNLGPETQFDLGDVPTFRKGFMGGTERTLGYALRVPDRAAYTAAFDDTVKGLMKANKLDKPTQEILEQANAMGLYRTFQDNSKAAQLFTGLKGSLNKVGVTGKDGKEFGLGDLILKYPKTPGNILDRGLDYSPAGIVKGITKAAMNAHQGKPFDQAALANSIGRATVGSGALVGTGAALGALGIITEKPSQDTDERNLQKASGLGGYQINTSALKRFVSSGFSKDAAKLKKGDKLVSYDWAQPASIPLSAGAALGKGKSAKDGATSSLGGFADGLNSLVEQPLVTGVSTLAGNIKNKGIAGAIGETVKGAPASFVPTLSNQARQLTDNTTRNSSDLNGFKQALNMAKNKVPGVTGGLPAQVDPLGRDKQNYQNGTNNPFNVLLNPSFVTKYDPKGAAELPLSINKNSGETKQYPRTAPKSVKIDGKTIALDAKQQNAYQKFAGQQTEKIFNQYKDDPRFTALSDGDKADFLSARLTKINEAAKAKVFGGTNGLSKEALQILKGETIAAKFKGEKTAKAAKAVKTKTGKVAKGRKATGGGRKGSGKAANSKIAASFGKINSTNKAADSALRDLIKKDRISGRKATVAKASNVQIKKNRVTASKVSQRSKA